MSEGATGVQALAPGAPGGGALHPLNRPLSNLPWKQGAVLFPQPQNRCRPPPPSCQFANSIEPRLGLAKGHRRFCGRGAPRPAPGRGIPFPRPPPPAEAGRRIRQQGLSCSELKKAKSHVSSSILVRQIRPYIRVSSILIGWEISLLLFAEAYLGQ